jgi:hypothetical protein
MTLERKSLPIGIQTFREIREGKYYYVDKTGFALRLIREGKYYFLSRPRRFGKSLFIDTLAELFAGNEALFRGLLCHDQWDWSVQHPVIRISFGGGVMKDADLLAKRIDHQLLKNAQLLGLSSLPEGPIANRFETLIQEAVHLHGQRVVVLVDEYDKPILDNLTQPDVARELRNGLRDLYSVIKDSDAHIRFAMLTGVSKFSKVSLFSGLNNLKDITIDPRYSALCGYTDADVDRIFAPELPGLDREEIRAWYNGYNWNGEPVYNPFDLLLLFDMRDFLPYWFETGTSTFLIDLLTERQTFLPDLTRLVATDALLSAFDVGDIATEALLFQTGYLTIDAVERIGPMPRYRLRYPNLEVRSSLTDAWLRRQSPAPGPVLQRSGRLYELLLATDFAGLEQLFTAFFASIPHDWFRNNPIAQYEGYYASVFYAYFASLGLDLTPEESSNVGRLDLALRFNQQIWLFEFKVIETAGAGSALAQLQEKDYAARYRAAGLPIHLIGVEFSREQRKVVGFAVETIAPW